MRDRSSELRPRQPFRNGRRDADRSTKRATQRPPRKAAPIAQCSRPRTPTAHDVAGTLSGFAGSLRRAAPSGEADVQLVQARILQLGCELPAERLSTADDRETPQMLEREHRLDVQELLRAPQSELDEMR